MAYANRFTFKFHKLPYEVRKRTQLRAAMGQATYRDTNPGDVLSLLETQLL